MSTKAFDEACQALARRSGSTSCDMSLDTRKDVSSSSLLAPIFRFLSSFPNNEHRGKDDVSSPMLTCI